MAEKKEKIGLFFGSFNPIHNGHLILSNYIVENSDLNKIWFVVSPLNPLKKQSSLLDNNTRLHLVELAINDNSKFYACNIEFSLPIPSYTINTLTYLTEKYPDKDFSLIIGEDNLRQFTKWKNYNIILEYYNIYVYPREKTIGEDKDAINELLNMKNVHQIDAPLINISASFIRDLLRQGKSIQYLVPDKVKDEIEKGNLYKK